MHLFTDCYFKRLYVLIPACVLVTVGLAIFDPVRAPLLSSLSWSSLIFMITIAGAMLPNFSCHKSWCLHLRFVSFNAMSAIVTIFTVAVCSPIMAILAAEQNETIDPLQYIALIGASVFWLQIYLCTNFVFAIRGNNFITACGLVLGLVLAFFPLYYLLALDFDAGPDLLMPDTGFLLAVMGISIVLLAVSEIMAYRYAELYDSDTSETRWQCL